MLAVLLVAAAMPLAVAVSGCTDRPETVNQSDSPVNESASDLVGMANPASTYCSEQGGETADIDTPAGEAGYCILPGNITCEEWAFYRNNICMPPA
jgi:putative hemolysin